jgi:hypothetical protein
VLCTLASQQVIREPIILPNLESQKDFSAKLIFETFKKNLRGKLVKLLYVCSYFPNLIALKGSKVTD